MSNQTGSVDHFAIKVQEIIFAKIGDYSKLHGHRPTFLIVSRSVFSRIERHLDMHPFLAPIGKPLLIQGLQIAVISGDTELQKTDFVEVV